MKYPKIAILEKDADKESIEERGGDNIIVYTVEELTVDPMGGCLLDDGVAVVVYEPIYKLRLDVQRKLIKQTLNEGKK